MINVHQWYITSKVWFLPLSRVLSNCFSENAKPGKDNYYVLCWKNSWINFTSKNLFHCGEKLCWKLVGMFFGHYAAKKETRFFNSCSWCLFRALEQTGFSCWELILAIFRKYPRVRKYAKFGVFYAKIVQMTPLRLRRESLRLQKSSVTNIVLSLPFLQQIQFALIVNVVNLN